MMIIGGIALAGVIIWYLLMGNGPHANSPLGEFINRMEGRKKVPWGGGTQQTPAGTRYLAGPNDLPAVT